MDAKRDRAKRLLSSTAAGRPTVAGIKMPNKRAQSLIAADSISVGSPEATRNQNLRPPWKKGQSGNPSGYPARYAEVIALARDHSARALGRLGELLESEDERVATVAAQTLLDRAWGKAREYPDTPPAEKPNQPNLDKLSQEEQRDFHRLLRKAMPPGW
jgi:hypothetical protein